jgi:hypothetical protein
MNTKAFSLALLLSAPAMLRCDFWNDLLAFLNAFNPPHQPSNPAPDAIVDEFCRQLENDLRTFQAHDRRQIIALTRQLIQNQYTLRTYESVSLDVAQQCARSAIIEYSKLSMEAVTNENWLKESMTGNVLAILEKTPHIDGQKLSPYFGNSLKEKVTQAIENRKYGHTPRPSTPQIPMYYPSVTQAPVVPQHVPVYQPISNADLIQRIIDTYDTELSKIGLSDADRTIYRKLYYENCNKPHYTEADLHRCMKKELRDGFITTLFREKEKLAQKIKNKELLQQTVEKVSGLIRSDIPDDTKMLVVQKIARYCKHNLTETLAEEMGIICSICCGAYRDQIQGGEAGVQVLIPCPARQHHVCSECAGGLPNNSCPSCRGTYSKSDLNRNAQQAEQAHRAREQAERSR